MARPKSIRGGRPAGEVSKAVLDVIKTIGRGTWRRVYEVVLLKGLATTAKAVRRTVENLVKRKKLAALAPERVPGARRPMRVYGLPCEPAAVVPLGQIMNIWGARP